MSLEDVVENIRARGGQDAEAIRREAKSEAEEILASARREAEEVQASRARDLEERVAALRRQETSHARLDAKRARLAAEREAMAEVRWAFEAAVAALPAAERERHLEALLARANLPDGRVRVAEGDVAVAEDLGIDVAGTFEGLGGVLVESPDGAVTENLRYENLLKETWEANLHDVASLVLDKGD